MKRLFFLLPLLALPLLAQTTPSDRVARGYDDTVSCNFDIDNDLVYGEADDDCNICDGTSGTGVVAVDLDGDATNESEVYVSGTGSNFSTCGGPADPCLTITYAVANRLDQNAGADNICLGGNVVDGDIPISKSGEAGTKTRAASGSEVRDMQYPTHPFRIVGWDQDDDGSYPPFDTDDVAVVDGSATDICLILSNSDRVEVGHITFRDCGDVATAPGTGNTGFVVGVQNHFYLHEAELLNINLDSPAESDNRVLSATTGNTSHLAVENVLASESGGFFFRGGFGTGVVSGPIRFKKVTRTAHCEDNYPWCTHADYWGHTTGVSFLDSVWDMNGSAWLGPDNTYLSHAQCAQDSAFVNNKIIDGAIQIEHSDSGFCNPGRPTGGDFIVDGNEFVITANNENGGEGAVWFNDDGGEGSNRLQGDFKITNNVWYRESGATTQLTGFVHGRIDNTETDYTDPDNMITVAGNTIITTNCFFNGGVVNMDAQSTFKWQDFEVFNNIFHNTNDNSDCRNINFEYAPTNLSSDSNVWDSSSGYVWNDSGGDFANWKSVTGEDANSSECDATFVDAANNDYHLAPNDLCALDNGTPLLYVTDSDLDGANKRPVVLWDAGADEVQEAGGGEPAGAATAFGASLGGASTKN